MPRMAGDKNRRGSKISFQCLSITSLIVYKVRREMDGIVAVRMLIIVSVRLLIIGLKCLRAEEILHELSGCPQSSNFSGHIVSGSVSVHFKYTPVAYRVRI